MLTSSALPEIVNEPAISAKSIAGREKLVSCEHPVNVTDPWTLAKRGIDKDTNAGEFLMIKLPPMDFREGRYTDARAGLPSMVNEPSIVEATANDTCSKRVLF